MASRILAVVLVGAFVAGVTACATDEYGRQRPMTDTQKGTLIGGGAGALIGGIVADKALKGALLGAVGGGIAGALVGQYMDRQKQDLEKVLRPELDQGDITIQKLPNNQLLISMTGATAFQVDSAAINPGFYSTLDKIANVMNRYGKTAVVIVGHTDNTGSAAYNQKLSERRAQSVETYFLQDGVIPDRVTAHGLGDRDPRASNDTPEGRALNRRVDITVVPVVA